MDLLYYIHGEEQFIFCTNFRQNNLYYELTQGIGRCGIFLQRNVAACFRRKKPADGCGSPAAKSERHPGVEKTADRPNHLPNPALQHCLLLPGGADSGSGWSCQVTKGIHDDNIGGGAVQPRLFNHMLLFLSHSISQSKANLPQVYAPMICFWATCRG